MNVSHQWLQTYFDDQLPTPEEVEKTISLHSFEPEGREQVAGDVVYDWDVLPNRAHDCLCHSGMADELATLLKLPLKTDRYVYARDPGQSSQEIKITIADANACRRYSAIVMENIQVGPSPDWLRQRLEAIGQRSINNVVDATNYVMFDLGQPLHAFDATKMGRHITVRMANEGEQMTTLSDEEIKLQPNHQLITDDENILALAGVKGGNHAQVDQGTTSIILEAANFDPIITRKTSRGLNLLTDSSKRFENEITPELTTVALDAVVKLLSDIAATDATTVSPVFDEYPSPAQPWSVTVEIEYVNRLLGTNLSADEMSAVLHQARLSHATTGSHIEVSPPLHRLDLQIPADIVEEIGRVYGYHNIGTTIPQNPNPVVPLPRFAHSQQLRNILTATGFSEVQTYSFTNTGLVEMANALASDKGFARPDFTEHFPQALDRNLYNAPLLGTDMARLFEIGATFRPDETWTLAIGARPAGKKKLAERATTEIDAAVAAIDTALGITLADYQIASHDLHREYDLDRLFADLPTPTSYDHLGLDKIPAASPYQPFSQYPFVTRDIAVWVGEGTPASKLEEILTTHAGDLLVRQPQQFDTFTKDSRTSYAYRLVFQAMDRTLTDDEITPIMTAIETAIGEKGWEVR